MAQRIPTEDLEKHFQGLIELQSEALGGTIISCSDEFFAPASCLLRPHASVSMKGQFGPNGALYDGWETRRHNPGYDWAIIKLGAVGRIHGLDIDTANFSGNEAPEASVEALYMQDGVPGPENAEWSSLVPMSPLGPSSRHLFKLDHATQPISHLKLTMVDGGIARLRAYGTIQLMPPLPGQESAPLDLAHVLNGGRVVSVSDQHFGVGPNLILPGRGKDMGDGWETKRSRAPGHHDWVVIKLGEPGFLEWTELDTLHFVGNFPDTCELFGAHSEFDIPGDATKWTPIMPRTKLGPHKQHYFQLTPLSDATPITHVRVVIWPDGGLKRVRLIGRRASAVQGLGDSGLQPIANPNPSLKDLPSVPPSSSNTAPPTSFSAPSITLPTSQVLPLTKENFAAYGSVIESFARSSPDGYFEDDERSLRAGSRGGVNVKAVNFGTARKYNFLAPLSCTQPAGTHVKPELNVCIFRCERQVSALAPGVWPVEALERHSFSSQSFTPMNGCQPGRYLVIVALPAQNGTPDVSTIRGFLAGPHQGICYKPGVWHHPLIALAEGQQDKMEFQCMVYETSVPEVDCELVEYESPIASVTL